MLIYDVLLDFAAVHLLSDWFQYNNHCQCSL